MFVSVSRIVIAAALAAAAATTGGSVARADTPVTSPRLTDMEAEVANIRAESEQLGGHATPSRSINTVRTRINEIDDMTGRLETVAEEMGATAQDLDKLRQEVGDTTVFGLGDAAQEVGEEGIEKGVEYCLTRGCFKVAAKALGWITFIGDVVEYGGKVIIREINEDDIRDLVRAERVKLHDLYELLSALRCERAAERAKERRLTELRDREKVLFEEIAHERQRLAGRSGRATRHAVRGRDTDPAGDEAVKQEYLDDAVRPAGPPPPPRRQGVWSAETRQGAMNLTPFAKEVLAAHNAERARFGAEPLQWNPALEATATSYANEMAKTGRRVHAARAGRGIERENINQGMIHWNTGQMLTNWLQERGKFTPGTFPNVCSGDWSQCGHYTQMIWPTTTDVGCGMASGSGFKWLVCRYSPGGNKDGQAVGTPASPAGPGRMAAVSRQAC